MLDPTSKIRKQESCSAPAALKFFLAEKNVFPKFWIYKNVISLDYSCFVLQIVGCFQILFDIFWIFFNDFLDFFLVFFFKLILYIY